MNEVAAVQKVRQELGDLFGRLGHNWDGNGASAPARHLYAAGETLMCKLLRPEDQAPSVVPLAQGGVQFEWSVDGRELEIEVLGTDRFEVFYEDCDHEVEGVMTFRDLSRMADLISRLRSTL